MAPTGGKKELSVLTAVRISQEMRDFYALMASSLDVTVSEAMRIGLEEFAEHHAQAFMKKRIEGLKKFRFGFGKR